MREDEITTEKSQKGADDQTTKWFRLQEEKENHQRKQKRHQQNRRKTKHVSPCRCGSRGIPGWRSGLAPAFGPGRDPEDPRDRIPRRAPGAWSLLLPLPVSLPLSLSVTIINKFKKKNKKIKIKKKDVVQGCRWAEQDPPWKLLRSAAGLWGQGLNREVGRQG